MKMNKIAIAILLTATLGCALSATVDARLGKAPAPSADLEAVEQLVCRGDVVEAERLLTARGFDLAASIEAIERAKLKCEKKPNEN